MEDELAAKQVLLDFELVSLLVLAIGVLLYSFSAGRRRALEGPGISGDYDLFDLFLMFFPAMLFLINPLAEVLLLSNSDAVKPEPKEPATGLVAIFTMLVNLGFYFVVGVMTFGILEWVRGRKVTVLFGLNRLHPAVIAVASIFLGVLSVFLCGSLIGTWSSDYLEGIFGTLDEQAPVEVFENSDSVIHLALSILMACVAAPVAEEFLFRGYMYGTMRRLTHPIFASIVVGALFAVAHSNLPALLPLWVFSVMLSLAYEWTRCLWVPIGMHAVFNAANIALMLWPLPVE